MATPPSSSFPRSSFDGTFPPPPPQPTLQSLPPQPIPDTTTSGLMHEWSGALPVPVPVPGGGGAGLLTYPPPGWPFPVPVLPRPPPRPTSDHIRDKGFVCAIFRSQKTCPVSNCPYAHIPDGTTRPLPLSACNFFVSSRCLRDGCAFFHGLPSTLSAIRATGATNYCPLDYMPTRDPLSELSQAELMLTAGQVCARSSGMVLPAASQSNAAAVAPSSQPPHPWPQLPIQGYPTYQQPPYPVITPPPPPQQQQQHQQTPYPIMMPPYPYPGNQYPGHHHHHHHHHHHQHPGPPTFGAANPVQPQYLFTPPPPQPPFPPSS